MLLASKNWHFLTQEDKYYKYLIVEDASRRVYDVDPLTDQNLFHKDIFEVWCMIEPSLNKYTNGLERLLKFMEDDNFLDDHYCLRSYGNGTFTVR